MVRTWTLSTFRNVSFERTYTWSQRTTQIINHLLLSVPWNLLCWLFGFCHSIYTIHIFLPICQAKSIHQAKCSAFKSMYRIFKDNRRIGAMNEVLCGRKYANSPFAFLNFNLDVPCAMRALRIEHTDRTCSNYNGTKKHSLHLSETRFVCCEHWLFFR